MKNGWYQDQYGYLNHYVNDKFHNEKSPAYIDNYGTKFWFQNNERHRIDGPAIEKLSDGIKEWWYQDEQVSVKSQQEFERYLKLKLLW